MLHYIIIILDNIVMMMPTEYGMVVPRLNFVFMLRAINFAHIIMSITFRFSTCLCLKIFFQSTRCHCHWICTFNIAKSDI